MIPQNWLVEGIGYLAAAANVFVFVSNTMIPLRIAAIAANALFAAYFLLKGYYPLFALNAFMAPINVFRLRQMRRLIADVRQATQQASEGEFDYEWLRPYMKPLTLPAGFTLHRKGDLSEEAYIIVRGEISLLEPGVTLKPGAFFGEMGLFTEENRRTATVAAATDVELLCVRYDELLELAAQNPQFGFYLMKLMMRRMQHNVELARDGATAKDKGATPSAPVIARSVSDEAIQGPS
ncbi:Crp/Fnr family transcriptional regulator [Methylocystis sp. S23]|jgi:CRP/FNR family cyclic AMP-dependent transcriptional regulator